jgi:hypothetical protein
MFVFLLNVEMDQASKMFLDLYSKKLKKTIALTFGKIIFAIVNVQKALTKQSIGQPKSLHFLRQLLLF